MYLEGSELLIDSGRGFLRLIFHAQKSVRVEKVGWVQNYVIRDMGGDNFVDKTAFLAV
jgi:hypothetical protein